MTGQLQLGFDELLSSADSKNRQRQFDAETAHLPATMEEALPFFRKLIEDHHAAMLRADVDEAMRLRKDAHKLAVKLNGGEPGILADDDTPGCVLERESAAPSGAIPLWGQKGEFTITLGAMRVRIEIEGVFGIASGICFWPGFSANAIDFEKPFLSATGYRSFLGLPRESKPGMTPDAFAAEVIADYVGGALKGKLEAIGER